MRICDGWQHACARVGITAPTGELDSTADEALLDVVKLSEVGAIDQAEFCRRVAPILRLSAEQVGQLSDAYLLGAYPGVDRLLGDVKAAGLKTACLSNTNANHWQMMTDPSGPNALPLDRLDYRFASQLMKLRKPDDAIYAAVEQAIDLPPSAILFFDDLPDNIGAAERRGWNAVQIAIDGDPITQVRRRLEGMIPAR